MSRIRTTIDGDFHKRLSEILEGDVPGWAKKLKVSSSLIRDRWFKGSYPGTDKLIKLIEISGVSADWLLFGKGEKSASDDPDLEAAREILSCGDEAIIRSFRERLRDYRIAIARKRELDYLKDRLAELEKKVESLIPGGDAPGREEAGGPSASRKKAM